MAAPIIWLASTEMGMPLSRHLSRSWSMISCADAIISSALIGWSESSSAIVGLLQREISTRRLPCIRHRSGVRCPRCHPPLSTRWVVSRHPKGRACGEARPFCLPQQAIARRRSCGSTSGGADLPPLIAPKADEQSTRKAVRLHARGLSVWSWRPEHCQTLIRDPLAAHLRSHSSRLRRVAPGPCCPPTPPVAAWRRPPLNGGGFLLDTPWWTRSSIHREWRTQVMPTRHTPK